MGVNEGTPPYDLPTCVDHALLGKVCELLGLPGKDIRALTLHPVDGINVELYVRDNGALQAAEPYGTVIVTHVQIPLCNTVDVTALSDAKSVSICGCRPRPR